jgi:hypothetical protein
MTKADIVADIAVETGLERNEALRFRYFKILFNFALPFSGGAFFLDSNNTKIYIMPSGKKRKRHKMATHKRKKRLRKNRHKKKK